MTSINKEHAVPVGHIPSGLFIVCAERDGDVDGYLASWVQQASFDPLMVSLAIQQGRPAYDCIMEKRPFSINVVGEHEMKYLKHFWHGYDPDNSAFAQVAHKVTSAGLVRLEEAKSVIECQMVESITPGDHTIVFAKVIGGEVFRPSAKSKTHTRKSGEDY